MVENKLEDVNISNENKVNPISSFIAKYILLPAKIISLAACGSNGDDPEYKTVAQGSLDTGDYKGSSYEIKIGEDPKVETIKIVKVREEERGRRRSGQFFFQPEVPGFIDDLLRNTEKTIMYTSGPGIDVNGKATFDFDLYHVFRSEFNGETFDNDTKHPADHAINKGLTSIAREILTDSYKKRDLDNLIGIYTKDK